MTEEKPYIFSADEQPTLKASERVTKIVLGKLDAKDDQRPRISLPDDLAERYPNLQLLHLWSLRDLTELPKLPDGLKELDVRGCQELVSLPELPEGLELLDLKGCKGLTKSQSLPKSGLGRLTWLHLDQCDQSLTANIEGFLQACFERWHNYPRTGAESKEVSPPLRELTLSHSDELYSLQLPAFKHLRKLVLRGCKDLRFLRGLGKLDVLEHLNLTDCSQLSELSLFAQKGASPSIRYLLTSGCDSLRQFANLDVRSAHRSTHPKENVAPTFRMLQNLSGGEPARLVMSKILLIGSGRCGKTTIRKALQWYDLESEQRSDPDLDPSKLQTSTPRIKFCNWQTDFELPSKERMRGQAHIWDFGGQEIYHNTHRLFAREGSVFIIAVTNPETHRKRVQKEVDQGQPNPQLYKEENEYRELKYWLDYIRSIRGLEKIEDLSNRAGKVDIRIIYTGTSDPSAAREDLQFQAGEYWPLLENEEIALSAVDFHNPRAEIAFKPVLAWARRSIGSAADGLGTRVPALFAQTADYVNQTIAKGSLAENHQRTDWQGWKVIVKKQEGWKATWGEDKEDEYPQVIGRYLHNCGRVFWLRREADFGQLILDQQWGVRLIYGLVIPYSPLDLTKLSRSLFAETDFLQWLEKRCPTYANLSRADGTRELFLNYLNECQICVRIDNHQWIAVQPNLLPDAKSKDLEKLSLEWDQLALELGDRARNHSFFLCGKSNALLGSSDYRALLVFILTRIENELPKILFGVEEDPGLASQSRFPSAQDGHYDHRVRLWKNGFQLHLHKIGSEARIEEQLALRVEWLNFVDEKTGFKRFDGGLRIELLSSDEEAYAERLDKLLFNEDGPLYFFEDKVDREDERPAALTGLSLTGLRGFGGPRWLKSSRGESLLRKDVAISYSSAQRAQVAALAAAIQRADHSCYTYDQDDEQRLEIEGRVNGFHITDIYDLLKFARVILLVASEKYFETPSANPRKNCYAPIELAEAILSTTKGYDHDEREKWQIGNERRDFPACIWVIFKDEGSLSHSQIEGKVKETLEAYYHNVTKPRIPPDPLEPDTRSAIDRREDEAVIGCLRENGVHLKPFIENCGRDSKQTVIIDPNKPDAFSSLLEMVQRALDS